MTDYNPEGFNVATEQATGRSSDLVGELVALRPLEAEKTIPTETGPSVAVFCEALVIDGPDGNYRNLGETPVFWEIVRRQLRDAAPWLVGSIRKLDKGRAYRCYPPSDDEMIQWVRDALKRHNSPNRVPVEDEGADDGPDVY